MAYEKTINLTGTEVRVEIKGKNCDVRNDSGITLYVSRSADIVPDADGVLSVPAGQAVKYCGLYGAVYLLGTGKVQICGNNHSSPLFKCAATSTETGEGGGTGADGKSAYEVAVANGFEGSVAEWLDSLHGEPGPQGESAVSAITPRGDYNAAAAPTYTVGDYITHTDGNTYVCKVDNPTNTAPTDGTMADPFWQLIALRGAQGPAGAAGKDATINGSNALTIATGVGLNGAQADGVYTMSLDGGTISNPNLLDNPDFSINQRGQTEYTSTGHTVDRWKMLYGDGWPCAISKLDDGVKITVKGDCTQQVNAFFQVMEAQVVKSMLGKTLTFSCEISEFTATEPVGFSIRIGDVNDVWLGQLDGFITSAGVFSTTGEIPEQVNGTAVERVAVIFRNPLVGGESYTIKRVKLELGSVATAFVPPNPATELAKCQRHQMLGPMQATYLYSRSDGNSCVAFLPLPVTPRIMPSIIGAPRAQSVDGNAQNTAAVVSVYSTNYKNGVLLLITGVSTPHYIYFPTGTGIDMNL